MELMKVGIFGGSFDPVHCEHVRCVQAAVAALGLERVFIVPSYVAPHKAGGARASEKARLQMCRIAFQNVPEAEVSDYEISAGGTSYSYLTCRYFRQKFSNCELYFLVGADMLENFFLWKNPQDIVKNVTVAAFGRGGAKVHELHTRFFEAFGCDFVEIPFTGEEISSTELRVALAFSKSPKALDEGVLRYIREHALYLPQAAQALELEKPSRREHSYRVARMACVRARSLGILEEKALLAALLHDCAKYVPAHSELLAHFSPLEGVPEPVLHQFTGAYLAENAFGIYDEGILNAIRYHTSGRPEMGKLEKLVFLADMLEEGREFEGVKELRALFWRDLDACLVAALSHQISYLQSSEKPIYPLTAEAYEWAKREYAK